MSRGKGRERIARYQVVSLPWVVRVGTFTTNVANNCIVSDLLCRLAISAGVEHLFLGVALSDLLVSSVVRSLVCVATVLASAQGATDYAGS